MSLTPIILTPLLNQIKSKLKERRNNIQYLIDPLYFMFLTYFNFQWAYRISPLISSLKPFIPSSIMKSIEKGLGVLQIILFIYYGVLSSVYGWFSGGKASLAPTPAPAKLTIDNCAPESSILGSLVSTSFWAMGTILLALASGAIWLTVCSEHHVNMKKRQDAANRWEEWLEIYNNKPCAIAYHNLILYLLRPVGVTSICSWEGDIKDDASVDQHLIRLITKGSLTKKEIEEEIVNNFPERKLKTMNFGIAIEGNNPSVQFLRENLTKLLISYQNEHFFRSPILNISRHNIIAIFLPFVAAMIYSLGTISASELAAIIPIVLLEILCRFSNGTDMIKQYKLWNMPSNGLKSLPLLASHIKNWGMGIFQNLVTKAMMGGGGGSFQGMPPGMPPGMPANGNKQALEQMQKILASQQKN